MGKKKSPAKEPLNNFEIAKKCYELKNVNKKNAAKFDEIGKEHLLRIISGVATIRSNIKITAEELHTCWIKERVRAGWSFGKKKDVKKKLHPCILAYCDLSKEQKQKSVEFLKNVLSMI